MRVPSLARALVVLGILLAFVGVRPAAAQTGKITGIVTDASSGQPIEGAQVVLTGTGRGTITGSNGRYFLLSVQPGEYTVLARRIGYQSAETRGVQVRIDVTTDVNFRLASAASTLAAVKIEAAAQPLIQPGTTGSQSQITAADIEGLPVMGIAGVLALQAGFLNVPVENTDVTAYNDERRGVNTVRIRGGRAYETQTLIDGLPINNFVLGGPSFDITNDAVSAVNYERGGFEAQYGNAMSGIINIAVREGGPELRGALQAQSSRVAGLLGSRGDEVRGADYVTGYLSGPVPIAGDRLRFMIAGRQNTGAARVLQFDNSIYDPFTNTLNSDVRGNTANVNDFYAGWRGVGFNAQRDLVGKLTGYITPSMKASLGYAGYQQQVQGYNPFFVTSGYDVTQACIDAYPDARDFCIRQYNFGGASRMEDILNSGVNQRQAQKYTIQGSTRSNRSLSWVNFDHTMGRTNYKVRLGRLYAAREACNYLTGVCLGDKIRNYTTAGSSLDAALGRFITPSTAASYVNPGAGSENFAGGDSNTTWSFRSDVQSQVTDHHNLQGGVSFQRHDIRFFEARNISRPVDGSTIASYVYGGNPWDAGIYFQDRVEYDFLTLKLGMRYDYTRADGRFFNNPLDPTNGTTAAEVCSGQAFGNTAYTFDAGGQTLSGLAACIASPDLLDSARRVAFRDDFGDAPIRRQFSPRIGVQFPLTERAGFFANWGIYSQNPTYNNMYAGTGIGRSADSIQTNALFPRDTSRRYRPGQSLEGTPAGPNFRQVAGNVPQIGNPRLAIERTSAYEIGFLSEFGSNFSIQVTGFAKDQSGLTGYRRGGVLESGLPVLDVGQTYNPAGTGVSYFVLVNTDYQTVRGLEMVLRRRLANHWGYDVQYAYQQCFTNAAPPELEIQKQIEGDVAVAREIRCEVDQPHLLTGILRVAFDQQVPEFRLSRVLRDTRFTLTSRAASGLPYTPTLNFAGDASNRLERNSGTGPATWGLDTRVEKGFRIGGVRYSAYVQVNNLLDRKNCIMVYSSTGRCDAGSLTAYRGFTGRFQNGGSDPTVTLQSGASTTTFDRPYMYAERRSTYVGGRVSF